MKRTFWSILVGAAAALPGLVGARADVAAVRQEAVKPASEALVAKRTEAPQIVRQEDDRNEDPAPQLDVEIVPVPAQSFVRVAVVAAPPVSPDLAPLTRRALGRPRVRAPDARA